MALASNIFQRFVLTCWKMRDYRFTQADGFQWFVNTLLAIEKGCSYLFDAKTSSQWYIFCKIQKAEMRQVVLANFFSSFFPVCCIHSIICNIKAFHSCFLFIFTTVKSFLPNYISANPAAQQSAMTVTSSKERLPLANPSRID